MKIPTVITPDVVGELVHIARDQAMKQGLDLAGQILDGPPITTATWPGLFYITEPADCQLIGYYGTLRGAASAVHTNLIRQASPGSHP